MPSFSPSAADHAFLSQALDQALAAGHSTSPNPAVGCMLVADDGTVLGQGHTQPVGGPHGEVMALRQAAERGHSVHGATAYVTLEPCSHHGRTGPCCDALAAAGVRRVVATHTDPNPLVAGRGLLRLRDAGVAVDLLDPTHPLAVQARELNLGFFSRMVRKTPWLRMKAAVSLDGKTALPNGVSQWITGPEARADGHAWRAQACAVLTGIGTVLQDNPRLDVRDAAATRQPHLVIVDSRLETPLDAALWTPQRKVFIYAAAGHPERNAALQARGASVVHLPNSDGKVDLRAMLHDLAAKEVNTVHAEAGHKLNGSLLAAGLVDELLVYVAPKLLGDGPGMAPLGAITSLDAALALDFRSVERVGPDLRIVARLVGRDPF